MRARRIGLALAAFTLVASVAGPATAAIGTGGLEPIGDREIVGGNEVPPGTYPWMAFLADNSFGSPSGQFCGASVIAPTWVLTAAHCVVSRFDTDAVVVGRHHLGTNAGSEIPVVRIIPHPAYNTQPGYSDNDLALIELAAPAGVTPVSLATSDHVGATATVMGWGAIRFRGPSSNVLLEVQVPIRTDVYCGSKYGAAFAGGIMLCAADNSGGEDSCSGDSGGPLVVPDGGSGRIQAGIVSWGNGCADARFPGVYTEVATYVPWIQSITGIGAALPKMHVHNMSLTLNTSLDRATARARVADESHSSIPGADVTVVWTVNGTAQPPRVDDTNTNGRAGFHMSMLPAGATIEVCVTDVDHPTYEYDAAASTTTCVADVWPGPAVELHVHDIRLVLSPSTNRAHARVIVLDAMGVRAADVAVTGEWFVDGVSQGTTITTTNFHGGAKSTLFDPGGTNLTFCVNGLEKLGFSHNTALDAGSCESGTWPS